MIDANGNAYVLGYTEGEFDGETNAGLFDSFLTKFDPQGNRLWSRIWGDEEDDKAQDLWRDGMGDLCVAGCTFDSDAGWDSDGWLVKLSPSGSQLWSQVWSTTNDQQASAVCGYGTNAIYVAGSSEGELDGQTNVGGVDCWLSKVDADGNKAWTRAWGTAGDDWAFDVQVSSDGSEISVSGGMPTGLFISAFDPTGSQRWFRSWAEPWAMYPFLRIRHGVHGSNIYVAGSTDMGFDGQTNVGDRDLFLSKWNAAYQPLFTDCNVVGSNVVVDWAGAWNCAFDVDVTTNVTDTNMWMALAPYTNVSGAESMSVTSPADLAVRSYRLRAREVE